ncbi:MAG: 30S ribosomal protein S20 [Candidatus Shapirobacteria bacterium]|jgi:ribosomal protein S20
MPIGKSAKKSLRKSVANNKFNVVAKKKIKEVVKKFLKKPTLESLSQAFSVLDKAKKTNLINRKKIARMKSSLSKKVGGAAKTEVKKTIVKRKVAVKKKVSVKK